VLTSNWVWAAPTFQDAWGWWWWWATDFSFPHAKTNFTPFAQSIAASATYTPPSWKVAYVTQADNSLIGSIFQINSINIWKYADTAWQGRVSINRPLILSDSDTIWLSTSHLSHIAWFLVDEDTDIIPVTTSWTYTVPADKTYIISAMYSVSWQADMFTIWWDTFNWDTVYNTTTTDIQYDTISMPVLSDWDQVTTSLLNHHWYLIPTANIS